MLEQHAEKIIGALFGLWLAVLTFWGKRELKRLDGKADKDEMQRLFVTLEGHIKDDKEMRRELTERLDDVVEAVTETKVSVARIAGQLDSRG